MNARTADPKNAIAVIWVTMLSAAIAWLTRTDRPKGIDMGVSIEWETIARNKGLLIEPSAALVDPEPAESKKAPLVKASFAMPATWIIPVRTISEANNSKGRRSQMGRKASQRRAVCRAMGGHPACVPFATRLRMGKPVRVVITRLGGRKLDRGNLWRCLKSVEDTVADCLGADDGSALWCIEVGQEVGGLVGVRVELMEAT